MMKTHVLAFVCGAFVALAVYRSWPQPVTALMPAVQAQSQIEPPTRGRACAAGILVGGYALTLEGDVLNGSNAGPYAGLGVLTFDGAGNATVLISQIYDGVVSQPVTTVGRYALGNDCAGTLLFTTGARFDIVAYNGGREVNLLQTNQGSVIRGVAKKQ